MKKSTAKLNAPLGASLVVLSSVFYASYGIWTTLMGNFFGGYTASALRSVLVLIILFPIALATRALEPIDWRHNYKYLIGSILASLLVWGPLYFAILHAGIGITSAINYTGIVIGMFVFGWLFNKEKFTKDKFIASALGIVGLFLIFTPSVSHLGWLSLTAAGVSGFSIAANNVIAKKVRYKSTQSTLFLWIASTIANVFMAIAVSEKFPRVGLHAQWFYLLLFAVASVAASWMFIAGMKRIEAGAAGILGLLEIVFGVFFGVAFFHEQLGPIVIVGILVVIAAASVPYIKDYNAARGTLEDSSA